MTRSAPFPTLPLLLGVCALGLVLAWGLRFVQDDAFISFGYARSLVEGNGLTWFGEPVEGYTNFLWVLWIALGLGLGADPVVWSQLGGLASFAATLALLWKLSQRITADPRVGLLALLLFVTNFTVASYATGGLETMLQTALLSGALLAFYALRSAPPPRTAKAAGLSLLGAAAVLTRPDSALPIGIVFGAAALALRRGPDRRRAGLGLALPFALVVGSWLAWKWSTYGALLPNTFHAKVDGAPGWEGLVYLGRFLGWYALGPVLALGLALRARRREPTPEPLWPIGALLATWWAYVVWVGGDFMEFRLLVPTAPLLFLALAWGVCAPMGPRARPVVAGLCALLLMGASARHALAFRGSTGDDALDSIDTLSHFYGVYADGDWGRIGRALARDLGGSDVLLASHATGAIPFYSRLRTVDMFGLNDPEIARRGRRLTDPKRPGHRVHATLDILRERGVHLVIGHPQLTPDPRFRDPSLERWYPRIVRNMLLGRRESIGEVDLVAAPLDGGEGLLMWYLTPHPRIDALLHSGDWSAHRVRVP